MSSTSARDLSIKEPFSLSKFLVKWELILVYIFIAINLVLMITKSNLYFSADTLSSIIQSGMDLSFMVMGMIFVLMLGDIDVSIASIMILSAMVTGLMVDARIPSFIAVITGILAGGLCGLFNGVLIAKAKMPAVIVTISTSMLFRGIVKIILDINVLKNFPSFYSKLAWNNVLGIPLSMICFLAIAIIFGVILHHTRFGRSLYMIGNSQTVSLYSGIKVDKVRMIIFTVMGLMAGISSIFFVGRMGGGVSSTMGTGYELDVIAICVLGGVSSNGGKGKVYGPVIATFIMCFLTYALGLMGIDANSRKILTGLILLIAVLVPNVNGQLIADIKFKFLYSSNKNIEAIAFKCQTDVRSYKNKIKAIQKDTTLDEKAKVAKIKEYKEKILIVQNKSKEATQHLKVEIKQETQKARERVIG